VPVNSRAEGELAKRIKRGAVGGGVLGLIISGFALMLYVLGGNEVFADLGVGIEDLIPFYLIGGVLAGLIFGLLSPLRRHKFGAAALGVLIALPLFSGAAFLLPEFDVRWAGSWVLVVGASILFGSAAGVFVLGQRGPGSRPS
jgi:hypothetical protein